jgi:AcrR family transcriptional regulator
MRAQIQEKTLPQIAEDNVKRRQIIEGARTAFLEQGFDAASMNDIARTARVSKGTLYVYFQNKEQLFQAICSEECQSQAEGLFNFDADDSDVETTLIRIGTDFVTLVCHPEKASSARTIIAIAERMPEIGRTYYETGPARGISRTKCSRGSSRSTIARSWLLNSSRRSWRRCLSQYCSILASRRRRSESVMLSALRSARFSRRIK